MSLGITRFAYGLLLPAMRADLGWSYTLAGAIDEVLRIGVLNTEDWTGGALGLKNSSQRVTDGSPAGATHVNRAGWVGRDKLKI